VQQKERQYNSYFIQQQVATKIKLAL
jgi:hypothetical protein